MRPYFKISEFAKFSGIPRKTLIFYDNMDLLKPEAVDDNGYRLYSYQQLYLVSIIDAFRDLGMPLKEIKTYMNSRTPELLIQVFQQQNLILEEKLRKLQSIQHMIDFRLEVTRQADNICLSDIILEECAEEIFFASDPFIVTDDKQEDMALLEFYDRYDEAHHISGYPLGACLSKEKLERKELEHPDRFYFRQLPSQIVTNRYVKPAGLYLVTYCQIEYTVPAETYTSIFDYIEKNNLTIAGCSYEEYVLDEVCIKDPEKYLLKISIQVTPSSAKRR